MRLQISIHADLHPLRPIFLLFIFVVLFRNHHPICVCCSDMLIWLMLVKSIIHSRVNWPGILSLVTSEALEVKQTPSFDHGLSRRGWSGVLWTIFAHLRTSKLELAPRLLLQQQVCSSRIDCSQGIALARRIEQWLWSPILQLPIRQRCWTDPNWWALEQMSCGRGWCGRSSARRRRCITQLWRWKPLLEKPPSSPKTEHKKIAVSEIADRPTDVSDSWKVGHVQMQCSKYKLTAYSICYQQLGFQNFYSSQVGENSPCLNFVVIQVKKGVRVVQGDLYRESHNEGHETWEPDGIQGDLMPVHHMP